MGNRLTNDIGSGSVPGLRVAPALATLLILLLCLQVRHTINIITQICHVRTGPHQPRVNAL